MASLEIDVEGRDSEECASVPEEKQPLSPRKQQQQVAPADMHKSPSEIDAEGQQDIPELVEVRKNRFVNAMVRFPCMVACIAMALCLIPVFGTVSTIMAEGAEIFATGASQDLSDIRSVQHEAFIAARKAGEAFGVDFNGDAKLRQYPQQEQSGDSVQIMYLSKNKGNLFTADNLQQIRAVEDRIVGHTNFSNFCKRSENTKTCAPPLSPLSLFYAQGVNMTQVLNSLDTYDGNLDNDLSVLRTSGLSKDLARLQVALMPCAKVNNPVAAQSCVVKQTSQMAPPPSANATFVFSTMLPVSIAITSPPGKELQNINAAMALASNMKTVEFFASLVDFFFDGDFSVTSPRTTYSRSLVRFGLPLPGYKSKDDREEEQKEAFASWFRSEFDQFLKSTKDVGDVEVLFFATPLVRDEFLSIIVRDMLKVLVSLAIVFAWIWFQTGSAFVAVAGVTEIFLSIPCAFFFYYRVFGFKYFDGLNAMTVFIVTAIGADDIFVFMDHYKQSAYIPAVCVDLRTRMTWVYSRASWAMLITSLTTCAAFVCTAVSPLPSIQSFGIFSAFVIMADYVLVITWFPACVILFHNCFENRPFCLLLCWYKKMFPCTWRMSRSTNTAREQSSGETMMKKTALEQLISGPFARAIQRFAPFVVLFFVLLLIPAAFLAKDIKSLSRAEESLPADHPFQRIWSLSSEAFPGSSQQSNVPVYVVWGVAGMNFDNVNVLRDGQLSEGVLEWDKSFRFDADAQLHIWEVCEEVRLLATPGLGDFLGRDNESPENYGDVSCPMDDWKTWLERPGGPGFPLPYDQVSQEMPVFLQSNSTNSFGQNTTYGTKLAGKLGFDSNHEGGSVRFIILKVESLLPKSSINGPETLLNNYNNFQEWVQDLNSGAGRLPAPATANKAFQTAGETFNGPLWVWLHTQTLFRTSAILGSVTGSILAFVVILLATQQIIIAFLAFVTIACILVSVLACMKLADYEMGTITSICITILAGFAVDYVVHLAHAFNNSTKPGRKEKSQEAFEVIGISVLSGMVTSVLAAAVLLTCSLQFFAKFGFFLIVTVVAAWIWGNCCFMSLMHICGPDDTTPWLLKLPQSALHHCRCWVSGAAKADPASVEK